MPRGTRRAFLKYTGLGAAAAATAHVEGNLFSAEANAGRRGLAVPGVHGYADRESLLAGETIAFYVSSSVPYELSVCRLGHNIDDPAGDEILHQFPASRPVVQPIYPGSYVEAEKGIDTPLKALSLECWVRPWKADGPAGLLGQFDVAARSGFGLFMNKGGSISFLLGNVINHGPALKAREWHHVVGRWDGRAAQLWIEGQESETSAYTGAVDARRFPLRLCALTDGGMVNGYLDGDLAMPAIYNKALSQEDIKRRHEGRGLAPATGPGVLACWPFSEERGAEVRDTSRFRRHGHIVNHATWMIGGPAFDANVARFGDYKPQSDAHRGHALRFASDDLYDCGWRVTHRYRVPANATSGIYVGRLQYEWEGKSCFSHITFIVRRAKRRARPPILVLAATNTWRAYNAAAFAKPRPGIKHVCGTNGMANSEGSPPAFSFYRGHAAGQGTYQLGLRMPWPAAGPYLLYGGPTDYSHLARADRFAHVWLERAGYKFDVIADSDLHKDPDQLRLYQALIINGHSEYWSIPMYEGLRKYLALGGNVVVLSGNSLFWRVSFNEEGTILECRKVDAPGEQVPASRRGESWHSHDGLRGGLLRECGYPGWKLIGLETLGWNNQSDPEQFGAYIVDTEEHFLFHKPEECGLAAGEKFGEAAGGALPRANGHEIDVRLSTLAELQERPGPEGLRAPSNPRGMVRLANGTIAWKRGGAAFDYFFRGVKPKTDQGGEMIYWERPDGGKVFNAGSIGAGWALHADPRFQTLMRNVLSHFGIRL